MTATEAFWVKLDDENTASATVAFRQVIRQVINATPVRWSLNDLVVVYEWAPGDMTRYTAVVSEMPVALHGVPLGEGVLVSVLHPRQCCAMFMDARAGDLFSDYVGMNLGLIDDPNNWYTRNWYTRNALTVMIGTILRRPPVVEAKWWAQVSRDFLEPARP